MADPYQYIVNNGVIVPDTSDLLAQVQTEYKTVFGADLVVTPDTPQGVLSTAEALARAQEVRNNAAVANQLNPNIAGGIFLDSIMALMGVQRTPATQTIVPGVTLTGVAGTVISAGTQAQTAAMDLFASLATVVLESDGTATVDFASVEFGPIVCAANTLTQVVTNVLGWETINNTNAGVLGSTTQSDQATRAYRNNTLAFQGVGLSVAITSALYNVPGVKSGGVAYRENYTDADLTIDGIFLLKNSVWACVRGGSDLDIAAALLENKSTGSNWNGDVEIDLIEPTGGQTYTVKFDRPTEIPILVKVTSAGDSAAIKQAVLDYAAGLIEITGTNGTQSNVPGFVVGSDVSPFEIGGAIMAENPGIFVNKVEISYASSISYTTNTLAIALDEIAVTDLASITVVTP